jgi:hypothetical protein
VVLAGLGLRWGTQRPGCWVQLEGGPLLGKIKLAPAPATPDGRVELFGTSGVELHGVQVVSGAWGAPLVSVTLRAQTVREPAALEAQAVDVPALRASLEAGVAQVLRDHRHALRAVPSSQIGLHVRDRVRELVMAHGVPSFVPVVVYVTAVPGAGPSLQLYPEGAQLALLPLGDHGWAPSVSTERIGKQVRINVALRAP